MKINTEGCDCCSGEGYVPGFMTVESLGEVNFVLTDQGPKTYDYILCQKCKGTGKVDWVRKVTGSYSSDIPELKELTDEVSKLMKEDSIFGVGGIIFKDTQKMILKKLGHQK